VLAEGGSEIKEDAAFSFGKSIVPTMNNETLRSHLDVRVYAKQIFKYGHTHTHVQTHTCTRERAQLLCMLVNISIHYQLYINAKHKITVRIFEHLWC